MRDRKCIAVVGAGLMGHGIGQMFGQAGNKVVLCDLSEEILQQAINRIESNLHELADQDLILPNEVQSTINRFKTTTVIEEAAADADLVIETVFEDLELKRRVFQKLDSICPENTILASNSSSFMPSQLASVTNRPDRVLGTHYFYPAHLIPLVEVVRSEFTSDATVEIICEFLKATGKLPVIAQKEAPGIIANRLQSALLREAFYIVERGIASPKDVDLVVKATFGRRWGFAGPFEMLEVQADYEMISRICDHLFPDLSSSSKTSPVIIDKIKRRELGSKTGKGFYEWTPESVAAWRRKLSEVLIKFLRANSKQDESKISI